MARFFTGTDRATWGATGVPLGSASWSVAFWFKNTGTIAANARIWDASQSFCATDAGATPAMRLQRDYSTTDGAWSCSFANMGSPAWGDWNFYCWTHVDGVTPTFYVNGVAKTVTVGTAPVGTIDTTTARTLCVGNVPAGNRAAESDIDWLSFYDRELTATEVLAAMVSGYAPNPRWLYHLDGSSPIPNLSGSAKDLTLTGSVLKAGPPTVAAEPPLAIAWGL